MKVSGRTLAKTGIGLAAILVIVGVFWGNVFVTNMLFEQNKDAVTITPVAPVRGDRGERGPKGDKGDQPSAEDVRQAVADYCAASGLCEGKAPSASIVYAAVTRYCTENTCRGESGANGTNGNNGKDGRDGKDAPAITNTQIQEQVAAYCAEFGCDGPAGENGLPGINGRTPVISCVIRSGSIGPDYYVAWKYTDEPNSEYRDIYQVPPMSSCSNPVDLRG